MEFVHLLDMLVQTAMMYAGAMETGTERRVDIVGLRQMIDLIGVLEAEDQGQPDRAGTGNPDEHDVPASDDVYGNREHDRSRGDAEVPALQELRASEERDGDSAGQRYFDGRAHDWVRLRRSAARTIRETSRTRPSVMIEWEGHRDCDRQLGRTSASRRCGKALTGWTQCCTPTDTRTTSSAWTICGR